MRLIIHAINVHQGGGKTLLKTLLDPIPSDLDTALNMLVPQRLNTDDVTALFYAFRT